MAGGHVSALRVGAAGAGQQASPLARARTSGMVYRSVSLTRSTSVVRSSPRNSVLSAAATAMMSTTAWLHSTTTLGLEVTRYTTAG